MEDEVVDKETVTEEDVVVEEDIVDDETTDEVPEEDETTEEKVVHTSFDDVFDLFLSRIEQDEWVIEMGDNIDLMKADWLKLLEIALDRFMFPRVDLTIDKEKECFLSELGMAEKNLLAVYMKNEWLKRQTASWKLIQQQYHTKDFEFLSQANHLDKLMALVELSNKECLSRTNAYSRVINNKPFDYRMLAGGA